MTVPVLNHRICLLAEESGASFLPLLRSEFGLGRTLKSCVCSRLLKLENVVWAILDGLNGFRQVCFCVPGVPGSHDALQIF